MAYFANGSEGEVLDEQCAECPIGHKSCPIVLVQLAYNYKQVAKGQEQLRQAMNILVDEKGQCQMRPLLQEQPEPTMLEYLEATR